QTCALPICFISFIMYFIISMNTNSKYDHDLVIEEYYKAELGFQDEINKEENAKKLSENLSWSKTEEGLLISFPEDLDAEKISGTVYLYRTFNKKLDFDIPITIDKHCIFITKDNLLHSIWNSKKESTNQNESFI